MSKKIVFSGGVVTGKSEMVRLLKKKGHTTFTDLAYESFKAVAISRGGKISSIDSPVDFGQKWADKWFKDKQVQFTSARGLSFFNCGVLEPLAIFLMAGLKIPDRLLKQAGDCRFTNPVFIFEPLPPQTRGNVWPSRFLSREESIKFHDLVIRLYSDQGYNLCHVPAMPVEKRADFILGHI